jgi:hypothetical protein
MSASFRAHELVLLDACCLLNLYATRQIEEILRTIPARFAVAERAAAEALYVLHGGSGDDANDREPVDLQPLITAGLLEILQPETEGELASFVNFAAELDDGEAMTCALAVHRSAAVATDDRKALRILQAGAPQVSMHTTTDLIKSWADSRQITGSPLKKVLIDVQERACFAPGKHDPLQAWWDAMFRDP